MRLYIILGLLLTSSLSFAKGVSVDWVCPKNSAEKLPVEMSFDDQGKLKFRPDIFEGNLKSGSADELSGCIGDFQKSASANIATFKQANCPASKDDFCYASVDYANGKILEKLSNSNLVKKNSDIKVSAISGAASGGGSSAPSTPEAWLEDKIAKKQFNTKDLNRTFIFNNKSYRVADFDSVIGDNIENVFMELDRDQARQYAQNYMVAKADILKVKDNSDQKSSVLNNLNQMFGYIYGDKGAEELAKILECKPEDNLKPIDDILKKLQETEKVSKCEMLEPGQHKIFTKDNNNYYSTANYTLKRKPDGNYQALLNVNFKQGAGSVSSAEMLERSRKCLSLAAPHMKSADGKLMELVVLTPDEVNKLPSDERPKKYDITIEGPNHGTNAASYAQTVDCATITHEMLHLLGLCDEYKEDRPQYAQHGWNCRVVTKAPSIMRDLGAFDKAVGRTNNCNCSSQTCSSIMNGSNNDVKELYTSQGFYDLVDYKLRNKYCKEEYINSPPSNMTSPDKSLVVLSDTDSSMTLESRFITTSASSPYYKILRSKVTCRCPAGDQECSRFKSQTVSSLANIGTRSNCPMGAPFMDNKRGTNSGDVAVSNNVLSLRSKPEIPSLLQPNHFNKILEGNCPGKAAGYQECAEFAYKTQPCNIPEKCNDDKYYLGSEQ